jgi:hypothetical protein
MSKVAQFVERYEVDGYDLICVMEAMGRRLGQSSDSLLAAALVDRFAALHILTAVRRLSAQKNRG